MFRLRDRRCRRSGSSAERLHVGHWAAWLLIVVFSGAPALADTLVEHGGCGAICKRTCCKPSDCTTMRARCCCTDRTPAGPAVFSRDAAVVVPPTRIDHDSVVARVTLPSIDVPEGPPPGHDDPPPRQLPA